jgi:hypothetical protein
MRSWTLALLCGAAFAVAAVPAQAAWKSYISRDLGFSFEAPGEVKTSIGTSRGLIAGPHEVAEFTSVEDGIEYNASVIEFPQSGAEGATILGEAEFDFQNGKDVKMDTFGRIEPGKDSVYGRKLTVDLGKDKGRATAAFYFTKNKLYQLTATILPENGDYQSPDPGRFIDSIAFVPTRAQEGSTELKNPLQ